MLGSMGIDSGEHIGIDRMSRNGLQRQFRNKFQRVASGRHAYFCSGFYQTANQLRNLIGSYAATNSY